MNREMLRSKEGMSGRLYKVTGTAVRRNPAVANWSALGVGICDA